MTKPPTTPATTLEIVAPHQQWQGKGLVVAGTSSDAGKSLITAAICRWLTNQGVHVAPFKSQNMSNNSMVCPDGGEIGRAQWLQAQAARVIPTTAMNPVLLKPSGDRTSHVIVRGKPAGTLQAGQWAHDRRELANAAYSAFNELAATHDVVIAEGAGSPAEINLRAGDYTNLGLARAKNLPMIVVGDIDRGGVLASIVGTLAVLPADDQPHLVAWLINKFRGDPSILQPGLRTVENLTQRPVLGVMPWFDAAWLDSEDSLAATSNTRLAALRSAHDGPTLSVAVANLPHISNSTDIDALAAEPGVGVDMTNDPVRAWQADLFVLPGSRATVTDLRWLREQGLADVAVRRAQAGRAVVGICGGYQMLAHTIDDGVESKDGEVPGLGLLPTTVRFDHAKVTSVVSGRWQGHQVTGYVIHHGRVHPHSQRHETDGSTISTPVPFLDGMTCGAVWGTMWHGAWESDDFRRAWLTHIAELAGSLWRPQAQYVSFTSRREQLLTTAAELIDEHVDTRFLKSLLAL